jgi:hypothetical protein
MELGMAVMPSGRLAMVSFASLLAMAIKEIDAVPPGRMDTEGVKRMMDRDSPEEPAADTGGTKAAGEREEKDPERSSEGKLQIHGDHLIGYRPGVALAQRSPSARNGQ